MNSSIIQSVRNTAKQQNSEAAHYRITSFLDGTAHEYKEMQRHEVLLIAKGFIEGAELSGLITLSESDDYSAQLKKAFG